MSRSVLRNLTSPWALLAKCAIVLCLTQLATSSAAGQDKTLPNRVYSLAFHPYYAGEYRDALQGFRESAAGGRVGIDGRWIDGICYHVMTGECYYHMGELSRALEQYEAALNIFLARKDWMLNVQFPATVSRAISTARSRLNWGTSRRAARLGHYPDRVTALIGRLNNEQAIRGGGVVQAPELRPVRAHEIARCTALAIRRRHDILGPTCRFDPMTDQLIAALSTRPAPPNHWSQAWIGVQLGLAYAAADRAAEAAAMLTASTLAAGQYDHHLTGSALLELGKIAFRQGKFDAAETYLLEATLAAAQFDQLDDVQEAFEYATANHIISGQKSVYPPLANAITWARRDGSVQLHASLLLLAAESQLAHGQTPAGANLLGQAKRAMSRTDAMVGPLGGRQLYHAAHAAFQSGSIAEGGALLGASLVIGRKASPWLFQIGVAEKLLAANLIGPRSADELFTLLLREPNTEDWKLRPSETLAVLTTPLDRPMELWFELVLLERQQKEQAIEIADRIRRRRFFSSLPFGGRLLALRWMLEAPRTAVNETAILQRQDFLLRYPAYAEISQRAREITGQLRATPPDAGAEVKKEQAKLFAELAELSRLQEAAISDVALRREPSEFCFPPALDLKTLQEKMPGNQLTLAFFNTTRAVHAFVIGKKEFGTGVISNPRSVEREVVSLLQKMGHFDRNQVQVAEHLLDDEWQSPAQKLWKMLVPAMTDDLLRGIEEIVIVPDGILWYVPFEVLHVSSGRDTVPLISKFEIRYLPTIGTMRTDRRGATRGRTAVVTGKVFPRDEVEVAVAAFEQLRSIDLAAVRVESPMPAPSSLFAVLCDRLVVLDEIDENASGPYDWSPMQADRGKPGSTLADWFALPWSGPETIVLPGFQTAAGDGLKKGGSGDEMFLAVCGLMSTGSRTVLISRWRTGGQTGFDLIREFVQQIPESSASRAWRRSVQLAMSGHVEPDLEPRIKASRLSEPLSARHPFFWAGYMLVDTGRSPDAKE